MNGVKKWPQQSRTQQHKPGQRSAQPHTPPVVQPKAAAPQVKRTPTAPPVYRPQPTPKVLQRKPVTVQPRPSGAMKSAPPAPPVYRPQAVPKVLQTKEARGAGARAATPRIAPIVHNQGSRPPVVQRHDQPGVTREVAAGRQASQGVPAAGVGVVQCRFDRPKIGRITMLWDKQKQRLHGLPDGGSGQWEAAVEEATDITTLEAIVSRILGEREKKRTEAEQSRKKESQERHEKHLAEQQAIAERVKAEKEERERIAEEHRQTVLREIREAEERRVAIELEERLARQQPKERRRLESLARLLESPDNVCVAVVKVADTLYAATNKGVLSPLKYAVDALGVTNVGGVTGYKGERERERDARKVAHYITEGGLTGAQITGIQQVGTALSDNVHAEMKILNWLVGQGKTGTYEICVSKLCCANCRIAIDEWNASGKQPRLNSPGSHGNYFVGWQLPPCIKPKSTLGKSILGKIRAQESDMDVEDYRGRSRVREVPSQRERSVSPPASSSKVAEYA